MVENDLGVGLVYPLDERYQRLDLYLADKAGQVSAKDQLSLLRQAAEAVSYAHRNRVVHRGLTPHAVLVRPLPDGDGPGVLVGDWQSGRRSLRHRADGPAAGRVPAAPVAARPRSLLFLPGTLAARRAGPGGRPPGR